MAKLTRTWWGTKFMDALSNFMEEGRLKRGRSYSGENRLLSFDLNNTDIKARIRGNKNPYFGIYKEPRYNVSLSFTKIPQNKWPKIIDKISNNVGLMSKLILNEMPDNIEDVFLDFKENFLPLKPKDINSKCSCPDWENPCKHVAGVYFKVASLLDKDPFLMFQLRGISKSRLQDSLRKTELGKALISSFMKDEMEIKENNSFYTSPEIIDFDQNIDLMKFWNGSKIIDQPLSNNHNETVPAILIKKQGDYPAFWHRDNSFITTMEEVYSYIRKKNKVGL
ncbi:SWIM zinc finger family protein [Pseudomonadota bacterium]